MSNYFLSILFRFSLVNCLLFLLKLSPCISENRTINERLITFLLANKSNVVRPRINRSDPVEVTFGIELVMVVGLDESNQRFSGKFWVRQEWYNEFMTWNASEWGNIRHAQIHPSLVWTPDIVLYNNADDKFSGGVEKYRSKISIYPDGRHYWAAPVTFTSTCAVNVVHFPFDGQSCYLKFGSWTYNADYIVLELDKRSILTNSYVPSTEWTVTKTEKKQNSIVYELYGSVPYDDVTYSIMILRKEASYMFYMITPCLMLVLTTLFSFSLPSQSGERIIVIVTNLLAFAIFLNMTNQDLPKNSDSVTTISVFYLILMVQSALSLFVACCIITVYRYGTQTTPPEIPGLLRNVFLKIYVKVYGIDPLCFAIKSPTPTGFPSKGLYFSKIPSEHTNEKVNKVSDKIDNQDKLISPKLESKLHHLLSKKAKTNSDPKASMFFSPQIKRKTAVRHETYLKKRDEEQTDLVYQGILSEMEFMSKVSSYKWKLEVLRLNWELIGIMLDRIYFWVFLLIVTTSTTYILWSAYAAQDHFRHMQPI